MAVPAGSRPSLSVSDRASRHRCGATLLLRSPLPCALHGLTGGALCRRDLLPGNLLGEVVAHVARVVVTAGDELGPGVRKRGTSLVSERAAGSNHMSSQCMRPRLNRPPG